MQRNHTTKMSEWKMHPRNTKSYGFSRTQYSQPKKLRAMVFFIFLNQTEPNSSPNKRVPLQLERQNHTKDQENDGHLGARAGSIGPPSNGISDWRKNLWWNFVTGRSWQPSRGATENRVIKDGGDAVDGDGIGGVEVRVSEGGVVESEIGARIVGNRNGHGREESGKPSVRLE